MRINDTQLEKATGGRMTMLYDATEQTVPGMNCPACGKFIVTTIHQIITASAIVCPNCQQRINIDRQNSRKAIESLRKVQEAQKRLEAP